MRGHSIHRVESRALICRIGGILVVACLMLTGLGCGSLSQEEAATQRAQRQLEWSEDEIQDHLRVFNVGLRTRGAAVDTNRVRAVEAYVAARLAEFRLQPGLAGSFLVSFSASRHQVQQATIQRAGGMDTTSLAVLGEEMIPDGRSAAGGALVRSVRIVGAHGADDGLPAIPDQQAVALAPDAATTERLQGLARAGARTAFIVGPLSAPRSARPVAGLLVLRLTPAAAARLLGRSPETLQSLLHDGASSTAPWTMPEVLVVQVAAETTSEATATNVMGIIPGKHPTEARQLVIVCAPLASSRTVAGMDVVHPQRLGAGAAAVLEATRHLGQLARFWPMPERTVLVAFWSDEGDPLDGLTAYLKSPLWSLDRTQAILWVGPNGHALERARALVEPTGIPIQAVAVQTDTLGPGEPLLVRDGAVVGRQGDEVVEDPTKLWQQAAPAALDAARETYRQLSLHAVTPALMLPVSPDSLRRPQATRETP
jgi:hypothetical protein